MNRRDRRLPIAALVGLAFTLPGAFPASSLAYGCFCHGRAWCSGYSYSYSYPTVPVVPGQPGTPVPPVTPGGQVTPGGGAVAPPVGPMSAPGLFPPLGAASPGSYAAPNYYAGSAAGFGPSVTPPSGSNLENFDPQSAPIPALSRGWAPVWPTPAGIGIQLLSDVASIWFHGQSNSEADLLEKAITTWMSRSGTNRRPTAGDPVFAKLTGLVRRVVNDVPNPSGTTVPAKTATDVPGSAGGGKGGATVYVVSAGGENTIQFGSKSLKFTAPAGAKIWVTGFLSDGDAPEPGATPDVANPGRGDVRPPVFDAAPAAPAAPMPPAPSPSQA